MEISDQIIKVLDDLARRFGVVLDWTQANIIPKIEELCAKYIRWEIATSIIWLLLAVVSCILFIVWTNKFMRLIKEEKEWWDNIDYVTTTKFVIGCCIGIAGIVVAIYQVFDIVRCLTFPELQLFNYIQYLISVGGQ